MPSKIACIIGAGPAGLTAAYELLNRTDIKPIILEMTEDIGGLSKTVNYKGNRIDIGGHRFFSKSDRVMNRWLEFLPQENSAELNPNLVDEVMLIRSRLSRILFLRQFFDYPLSLTPATVKKLGLKRIIKIGISYIAAQLNPNNPEASLEDFFINRFGRELYSTFFEDYTQKVWGVPCRDIPADWGAQRVKGLSISKAIYHALKKPFTAGKNLAQKDTETSLIEKFLYPKYGPGQLWEQTAGQIREMGGEIRLGYTVVGVECRNGKVVNVSARNQQTGETIQVRADYVISSMPVKELIAALEGDAVQKTVADIASGLIYRDFITVGVLLTKAKYKLWPDNWIYVQEKDVKVGRIQVFNNWSPYMVKNADCIWLGLEYFCNKGDNLWAADDAELQELAANELKAIGFIDQVNDVIDSTVIRMPKAYPAYFGSYDNFNSIRQFTDSITNLFLIGRNGMHRYNNMDHSMLTAMAAVDNIIGNVISKDNIWSVNAEQEYHEQKTSSQK